MAAVTICNDFWAPKNKVRHCFPIYLPWSDGTGCHDLSFFKTLLGHNTRLSGFTFTFHFHALEKEMATHSSVLAWRIPGTGEPGGLSSMGSHRVGHDWSDTAAAGTQYTNPWERRAGMSVLEYWLPYMLLPWLGEMVCHMTLSKIWQAVCFFQKMQKLDHSCRNKEKSDLVCFSGRFEAVIIQLPQVENIAFIIRALFPSSKSKFPGYFKVV